MHEEHPEKSSIQGCKAFTNENPAARRDIEGTWYCLVPRDVAYEPSCMVFRNI